MTRFLQAIASTLISLVIWTLIINAVLSWLVAFDVVNLRNRFVYSVARGLDAFTSPILAPVRRFVPTLGGLDLSPVIVIIVLNAANVYLIPWAFAPLRALIG
jgi:YggT family protein